MRRVVFIATTVLLIFAATLVLQLLAEPQDVDISSCQTQWRDGRIVAVVCPGGIPG